MGLFFKKEPSLKEINTRNRYLWTSQGGAFNFPPALSAPTGTGEPHFLISQPPGRCWPGPAGGASGMQRPGLALLALAACVALRPSEAILPIASSCCTEVSHHISRRLLERVNICRIQKADGDCDLAAVILHVKRRRICVSPHNHVMKRWMKEQAAKKNAKGSICHKRQHHSKGSSKGAQQEKQKVHGHKTPY